MEIYERGNQEEEGRRGGRLIGPMEIIRRLSEIRKKHRNCILTIGTFDGIHFGHKAIIKEVIKRAKSGKRKSAVLTFEPNPLEVFDSPGQSITTTGEKIELIRGLGVNILILLRFNKKFASLSSWQFIRKVILRIAPREVVVGSNHTFGRDGRGNVFLLKKAGKIHHFKVSIINLKRYSGESVNSTQIRSLIRQGDVQKARSYLGRYFSITGKVIKGKGRGRILGFPTANLKIPSSKILPKNGVYASYVYGVAKKYEGIINVGYRPTFREKLKYPSVEVFIKNFRDNLYGKTLRIEFVKKIRDEKKFKSISALKLQIKRDILKVQKEA